MNEKLSNEELFQKGMYDELYKANVKFIYKQANNFAQLPFEECVSAGNLGFTKAIKTYNPNNNIKFITYASKIITNEILMLLRKEKKHFNDMSFDGILCADKEGNKLTLEDILQDDTDIQEDLIYKSDIELLKNTIRLLPKKYSDVILLSLKGLNQNQISEVLGNTQSYVSRLLKKAIKKLKELMESDDSMIKKNEAIELIKQGLDNHQIAERLDSSPNTISVYRTQYNSSMKNKVFALFDTGKDVPQIAKALCINGNTIFKFKEEWLKHKKSDSNVKNDPNLTINIEKDFEEIAEREKTIQKEKIKSECVTGNGVDTALHFKATEVKPKHILKATKYEGKVMDYNINDGVIGIHSKENASNIDVSKENIDLLIQELKELKEVL